MSEGQGGRARSPLAKAGALLCLLLGAGLVLAPLLGAAARPRSAEELPPAALGAKISASAPRGASQPLSAGYRSVASLHGGLAEGLSFLIAERARAAALADELAPERLGELGFGELEGLAGELFAAAGRGGLEPNLALAGAFPEPEAATSLIASDRDLADFKAAAKGRGRAAEHYAKMAELVPAMRPLRSRYEFLLKKAYEKALSAEGAPAGASQARLGLPSLRKEIYPPSKKSLDYVHPFALDIFFISVERFAGGVERGPEVLSVAPGIVLAAASDWVGGPGQASYKGGGFSPNSGNGVIAYDPATRRFYSYFHLSELEVGPGSILRTGTVLGRGGDTGSNARKDGHGGHVHLEIFDAARARPLPAREIRELLFGK